MKSIDTLESDILELLEKGVSLSPDTLANYGANVAKKLDRQLTRREERTPGVIRVSEIGVVETCARKFWYTFHTPVDASPLTGAHTMKFLYGDIVEDTALTLAKAAGHTVEQEQATVEEKMGKYTIVGHIDALIDGALVDVKSTSPYGMKEFLEGRGGDKFGYRAQLNIYRRLMNVKRQGWLAVDKQNGHIRWIEEDKPYDVLAVYGKAISTLEEKDPPPHRLLVQYEPSGNAYLGVECSYCPFKEKCWSDANKGKGLRSFKYSNGVRHFVQVVRTPRVEELE